jgi:hypothetical protein
MPSGLSDKISEEALRSALETRCLGGSWRGLARSLAWRVLSAGAPSSRSIEALAETAETMLATEIDEALWVVERVAAQAWQEFLAAHPEDEEGALVAARLDATEESVRLVGSACDRVLEGLLSGSRRAA